jgi:hypothetical protein
MQLGGSDQFIWSAEMSDSDRMLDRTLGCQHPVNIREHPKRDFCWPNASDGWLTRRVRSVSTTTSDIMTFTTYRSVRSPRNLLSWPSTVMFWMRGHKYLSHLSMGGLLLICSAEKHLWSVRECKSLVGWLRFDNARLRIISAYGVASVHPPFSLGLSWSSESLCLLLLVIAIT